MVHSLLVSPHVHSSVSALVLILNNYTTHISQYLCEHFHHLTNPVTEETCDHVKTSMLQKGFFIRYFLSTWYPIKVRHCPAARGPSTDESTKLLPACWSGPWGVKSQLFQDNRSSPKPTIWKCYWCKARKDGMSKADAILPDGLLGWQVCGTGSIQRFRLCITLILIQEKPKVVHRKSLSTNSTSSSHPFASNIDINLSQFNLGLQIWLLKGF